MKISIPKEPTYYYEITGKEKRLLFWIPGNTLKAMVDQGKVKKTIIEDYPDGIDVKVTQEDFDDYKEKYGLELGIDPSAVWNAFLSLYLKDKETFRGVGYIPRKDLEPIADIVNKELEKSGLAEQIPITQVRDRSQRRKLYIKQAVINKKRLSFLKKYKVPRIRMNKPVLEQFAANVEMTKGDKPFKVFSAIQQRKV